MSTLIQAFIGFPSSVVRSGRHRVRPGPGLVADPHVAVLEALGLPDGRSGLGLVDRVAGGQERRVPVRPDGHDGDRDDPERHLAGPMDDRQPRDAEALGDLVGDGLEDPDRHRVVGLVFEGIHRPPGMSGGLGLLARGRRAGCRPGPAEEADDGAVLVRREAIGELGEDLRPERRPRATRRSGRCGRRRPPPLPRPTPAG